MTDPINHAGKRYGRLVAIKDVGLSNSKTKSRLWLCRCDCGKEVKGWRLNAAGCLS